MDGACHTILIVDDNEEDRYLMARALRVTGMQIHCAEDGMEALRLLRELRPKILVTDLNMPGMDGLRLTREAARMVPGIMIVLCTAALSLDITQKADDAGVAAVFGKPVNCRELIAFITRWGIKSEMAGETSENGRSGNE